MKEDKFESMAEWEVSRPREHYINKGQNRREGTHLFMIS